MSQPQGPAQQQRSIPQSKEALLKSYSLKLREDVKSMLDNFTEIIKLARVSNEKLPLFLFSHLRTAKFKLCLPRPGGSVSDS